MKKIIIVSLLVALSAASSFAADTAASTTAISTASAGLTIKSGTATIGKLSTGDQLGWSTATTGYAVVTQHINGVKAFGTAHDSTAITWMSVTKGATVTPPGSAGVAAVSGAGWSSM